MNESRKQFFKLCDDLYRDQHNADTQLVKVLQMAEKIGFKEMCELLVDKFTEAENFYRDPDTDQIINTPQPVWAKERAKSYLQIGVALCTRDGTKIGNGVLLDLFIQEHSGKEYPMAVIRSDIGNLLKIFQWDLPRLFHPPMWVLADAQFQKRLQGKKHE